MANPKNLEEGHFAEDNSYPDAGEHQAYDHDNFHGGGKVEENPYESNDNFGNGGFQQSYDQGYNRGGYGRPQRGRGNFGGGGRGSYRGGGGGSFNRYEDRGGFNPRQDFGRAPQYGGR